MKMNIFPNYTGNDLLRFSFKIKVQCVKFWKNNILRRTLKKNSCRTLEENWTKLL